LHTIGCGERGGGIDLDNADAAENAHREASDPSRVTTMRTRCGAGDVAAVLGVVITMARGGPPEEIGKKLRRIGGDVSGILLCYGLWGRWRRAWERWRKRTRVSDGVAGHDDRVLKGVRDHGLNWARTVRACASFVCGVEAACRGAKDARRETQQSLRRHFFGTTARRGGGIKTVMPTPRSSSSEKGAMAAITAGVKVLTPTRYA